MFSIYHIKDFTVGTSVAIVSILPHFPEQSRCAINYCCVACVEPVKKTETRFDHERVESIRQDPINDVIHPYGDMNPYKQSIWREQMLNW